MEEFFLTPKGSLYTEERMTDLLVDIFPFLEYDSPCKDAYILYSLKGLNSAIMHPDMFESKPLKDYLSKVRLVQIES